MTIFILDGSVMMDRPSAYAHIKKTLRLPGYFGENLDALADCLSEFDSNCVIILTHTNQLLESLGDYGSKMVRVFNQCSDEVEAFTFIQK